MSPRLTYDETCQLQKWYLEAKDILSILKQKQLTYRNICCDSTQLKSGVQNPKLGSW